MSKTPKDVLSALCSEITPLNHNATQESYALKNDTEAKLAYEVLLAYGFDVNLYRESGTSRLYLTRDQRPPSAVALALDAALAHATTLKTISDQIFKDNNDINQYINIRFQNTATQGKQITIHYPPAPQDAAAAKPYVAEAAMKPSSSMQAPMTPPAPAHKTAKASIQLQKKKEAVADNVFSGAPSLAKKYPFGIQASSTEASDLSFKKRMTMYVLSNLTSSLYAFFAMLVATIILLTLFGVSKGFLCPDFIKAKQKNPPWYCRSLINDEQDMNPQNNVVIPPPP